MLFNSYIFLFVFLPITLVGFYFIGSYYQKRIAISWLFFASLVFYGWWSPFYLLIIVASILLNYSVGIWISTSKASNRKYFLILGVTANLLVIGYYKYAVFFITNFASLTNYNPQIEPIILPLGISFFTFQQIAYLTDRYHQKTKEHSFLDYCLFVAFFPQLIAGPIVNQKEILPQLNKNRISRINFEDFAVGLTIFSMGLAKKTLIADNIARYATPAFEAVGMGTTLSFFEAWLGAIAYTLQLYFDFSGYSDMAVGLARLFGIRLPLNFNSPYKAVSIIDFWRRWHITLSRFLRDYLYISLGGSRKGTIRRYQNILITMLLGGLWHGAGWTFVFWGGLHGFFLLMNHFWRSVTKASPSIVGDQNPMKQSLSRLITFVAVVVAWVFFRSNNLKSAFNFLSSMVGINGISLSPKIQFLAQQFNTDFSSLGFRFEGMFPNNLAFWQYGIPLIFILLVFVWFSPNTQQVMGLDDSDKDQNNARIVQWIQGKIAWKPNFAYLVFNIVLLTSSIMAIQGESEFLYFQF